MTKKPVEIDNKIKQLFAVIHKQQKEVDQTELDVKRPWKTNCSFVLPYSMQPANIQVASEERIVSMYADMLMVMEFQATAATTLGVAVKTQWGGFDKEDWIDDFKKRIATIKIKNKKRKLEDMERRLEAIVSPEQRREMELEAILYEME